MDEISKQAKRQRVKAWQAEQRAMARSRFPLSDRLLEQFFSELEALWPVVGCFHDLRSTEEIIARLKLAPKDREALLDWCNAHGGFCDCEVAANTLDHWQSNRASNYQ